MPKKKSSKTPKALKENKDVVKGEKPPSVKKERKSEIDEIFAGKKRKKSIAEKPKSEDGSDRPKKMKSRKENEEKESKDGGVPSRPRKRTGDGFTIFTEEELGVGNADAGGTPLCPFDCSCCF